MPSSRRLVVSARDTDVLTMNGINSIACCNPNAKIGVFRCRIL